MSQMKTFDASTLFISPLASTPDVVDGLITQGLNLFGGASKTGKSWLLLWTSLRVSQGLPLWEGIETHTKTAKLSSWRKFRRMFFVLRISSATSLPGAAEPATCWLP